MFFVGQPVVCIDDTFTPLVRALYQQLPSKGTHYTIRSVSMGRTNVLRGQGDVTFRVLLNELTNSPDPRHADMDELGFQGERFAPLIEIDADEIMSMDQPSPEDADREFDLVPVHR